MGRGRRIQDFRNLNLDNTEKKEIKKKNIKSSMTEKEFIIEVEEKETKKKPTKNVEKNPIEFNDKSKKEKIKNKKINSKNKNHKKSKLQKKQLPKTYVEEEYNKTKKEKNKKTSLVVSTFLFIFILVGVIAGCLTTPTFDVKYIETNDGENITSSEIEKYFREVKGKNTFLTNLNEISKEITTHPYVYEAEITRKLPDKLNVKYTERKPYAMIKYIESYVLIDKYGSILEILKENKYPNLPIIYGIETEEFIPGKELEGVSNLKFENTVYLIETAEHVSFDYAISEINYTDSDNIKFSMSNSNVQIIYGSIERDMLTDKLTYLNEILKELQDKKGTLDISSANYSEKVIFTEILK